MKKYLSVFIWLVALLVVVGALLTWESDLLWKLQEQNLFLHSRIFFEERMLVPGGLLSWAANWLTQFFFYPWLGTLLLCACWLLLMALVKKAFALPNLWMPLALVPVALLLLTIVDMGYWVYLLKLPGHAFVATLGTIAVAALLWALRTLSPRYGLRVVLIAVTALVGYPLLGIYGISATLLMGFYIWRQDPQPLKAKVAGSVVALAGAFIVPQLCYRLVYYQTNAANIYYAGLPLFFATEEHHAYYLPYYGLALFFVLMALLRLGSVKRFSRIASQVLVLGALVWVVATYWYRDENFHHELRMQRCIEQNDWQGVVAEAAQQEDEPTRAIVMMRNLALSRLGRQADEMYLYRNGSKHYEAPFGMRLMLCVGPQIYYHYGMTNYSARLSTEMGVEFGWSVANLKLLAKCAILNKEENTARKYLGLLRQTTFYDAWARQAREMDELKTVARMMHYTNVLSGDQGDIERFLMNRLAESTYKDDALFQEQALLATLWTKSESQFWRHFSDYVSLHPNDRMPRYIQEAAYLYGKLEERPQIDQMPFDQSVRQSFENFMLAAEQFDETDVNYAREGLKAFCDTYYYDYYLMRELPEY
ncbi:MAG: hypothetical protein IJ059_03475 [Prevotella sp.]|nr:hypothetical protein [Prevotella sp.]